MIVWLVQNWFDLNEKWKWKEKVFGEIKWRECASARQKARSNVQNWKKSVWFNFGFGFVMPIMCLCGFSSACSNFEAKDFWFLNITASRRKVTIAYNDGFVDYLCVSLTECGMASCWSLKCGNFCDFQFFFVSLLACFAKCDVTHHFRLSFCCVQPDEWYTHTILSN